MCSRLVDQDGSKVGDVLVDPRAAVDAGGPQRWGAPADAAAAQRRRCPSRLEPSDNNVARGSAPGGVGEGGHDRLGVKVVAHRCKSRLCPKCGMRLGYGTRHQLERAAEAGAFKVPVLITLTIDRKGTVTGRGFSGPEEAFDLVTAGRYVAHLMRLLGVKVWVAVLEPQMKTGEGWPHWHVLCDLDGLPGGRLDYRQAWHYWRDLWKLGGVDVSVSTHQFSGPLHAVRYITTYVTKRQKPPPAWMLDRSKRIRVINASRALRSFIVPDREGGCEGEPAEQQAVDEAAGLVSPAEHRTHRERLASCGRGITLLAERVDERTGALHLAYRGESPLSWEDLLMILWTVRAVDGGTFLGGRLLSIPRVLPDGSEDSQRSHLEVWFPDGVTGEVLSAALARVDLEQVRAAFVKRQDVVLCESWEELYGEAATESAAA